MELALNVLVSVFANLFVDSIRSRRPRVVLRSPQVTLYLSTTIILIEVSNIEVLDGTNRDDSMHPRDGFDELAES